MRTRPIARLIAAAAATLLLLLLVAGGWWRFARSTEVALSRVAEGAVEAHVVGPATLQARVALSLSARSNASVRQVHADVGDQVKRGQLLLTLDDADLSARRGVVGGQQEALQRNTEAARATLAKARAELTLAQAKQRRDAELLAQGYVAPALLEASEAALAAAQAGVDAARAALAARAADARTLSQEARYADALLSYTRIVAPMDGVLVQRLAEPGSMAIPGAPLLKLVDPATLWLATRVDEAALARLALGQRASIRLRSGEILAGRVARIARQSDAATRELDVHVSVDGAMPARFAIDQEAEVSIATGAQRGLVLPLGALLRDAAGRQGVLLVEGGRAQFRAVETGAADARQVLVREGLRAGDWVVREPAGVRAGQRVHAATP